MDGRVADHSPGTQAMPPRLKLRFHQEDHLPLRSQEVLQRRKEASQGDERRIHRDEIKGLREVLSY